MERATLMACPATVPSAMASASSPAPTNTVSPIWTPMLTRVSKLIEPVAITRQATSQAIGIGDDHRLGELPGEQPDDVAGARAEHLPDPDLLGAPLGGEGGEAEQAEAGDDHREGREAGEHPGLRGLLLVELGDLVLAEHAVERNVGREPAPGLLDPLHRALRIGGVVAKQEDAGIVRLPREHDRIDRLADRAEARIPDNADDPGRDHSIFLLDEGDLDQLADRVGRVAEAEPPRRKLVDHDIGAAGDQSALRRRPAAGRGG